MQFSDSNAQHAKDAMLVFDRAVDKSIWACTGTEAGGSKSNHDLRDALIREAGKHEFFIFSHPLGEWVALNKRFLENFEKGFEGPFIKGTTGLKASQGAHSGRGVAWASGTAKGKRLGRITVGSAHYLTNRSEAVSGSNDRMVKGINAWATKHGKGNGVVFLGADVNTNDKRRDVFNGRPLTTIADELKKWPATMESGAVIDIVASYDHDGRVKAKSYDVLDDREYKLNTDHYLLQATYEITERAPQEVISPVV